MRDSILATKYTEFNGKLELGSEIFNFVMAKTSFAVSVVPYLFLTIGNYFIFKKGDESYILPFFFREFLKKKGNSDSQSAAQISQSVKCHQKSAVIDWRKIEQILIFGFYHSRLPFDWKTPLGYLVAYFIVSVAAFCTFNCAYLFCCFLIGSCWLSVTMVTDITSDLDALNVSQITHDTRQKLTRCIINIVQFHSDAKQLRSNSVQLNEKSEFSRGICKCKSLFVVLFN